MKWILLKWLFCCVWLTGCSWQSFIVEKGTSGLPKISSDLGDSDIIITKANSLTLNTQGGRPPYIYEIKSGTGTIAGSVYVPASDSDQVQIAVVDAKGQRSSLDLTVKDPLVLSKTSDFIFGPLNFSSALNTQILGGIPPFSFSIVGGGGSVHPTTGAFSMPNYHGTSVVQVTDRLGNAAQIDVQHGRNYFTGPVKSIAVDGNNAYLAGEFNAVDAAPTPAMAQLDYTTGLLAAGDCNFNHRISGSVSAMASTTTHLFLGGAISAYDGRTVQGLLKIKISDCSIDESFSTPTGFNGTVNVLLLVGDALYVGGYFSTYRTAPVIGLAKLNATTGVLDTVFSRPASSVGVLTIAYDNGFIYAGGGNFVYDGNTVQGILKVDAITGNLDTTFSTPSGFTGMFGFPSISKVVIFNNAIYVGGTFNGYRGATVQNIAKLNLTNGNLDVVFTQTTGVGFPDRNRDMTTDGVSLFVAGEFWTYRGLSYPHLLKLNANSGAVDVAFTNGIIETSGNGISRIFYHNNSIYIGGIRNVSYRNQTVSNLIRVDSTTGNLDTTFSNNLLVNANVNAIGILTNGNVFVGGNFDSVGGQRAAGLAKMDLNTGLFDTTFSAAGGFNGPVEQILVSGGFIYVTGNFTTYQGQPAVYLAKVDKSTGALDTTFSQATGPSSPPSCFHIFGGSLYVGGNFTGYRGSTVARIIKISLTDGSLDTTFSQITGVNSANPVTSITDDGTAVFIGGSFTTYRGSPARSIAKLNAANGNLDGVFSLATAFNLFADVSGLIYDAGNIYATGSFSSYRGAPAFGLAKMNSTNGNLDAPFTQATGFSGSVGFVVKRFFKSGSVLYVLHGATHYRGVSIPSLIKVDTVTGDLDTSFNIGTSPNNTIFAAAPWNQKILVGGSFTMFNSNYSIYFAPINLNTGAMELGF